nr:MAG TPA: hypothetical protein [Caudoviricetes sp.]DAQ87280.1 MAG TPA: hypothetical protein [Caudoviricetes sp.]
MDSYKYGRKYVLNEKHLIHKACMNNVAICCH